MSYRTILVNLEAGQTNVHLLRAAKQLALRFDAEVIGCAACTSIGSINNDGCAYEEMLAQDSKDISVELRAAEAEFHEMLRPNAIRVEWHEAGPVLSISERVVQEASCADLVMVGTRGGGAFDATRQVDLGDLVMHTGRPVLLIPPMPELISMDRIMVGWTDTREARRALADAIPLLQQATEVSIVEIATEDELEPVRVRLANVASWLARHGIVAQIHARSFSGSAADALDICATEMNAHVIVTGAYGHTRVREWAFGGVTRAILNRAIRPSFISH